MLMFVENNKNNQFLISKKLDQSSKCITITRKQFICYRGEIQGPQHYLT